MSPKLTEHRSLPLGIERLRICIVSGDGLTLNLLQHLLRLAAAFFRACAGIEKYTQVSFASEFCRDSAATVCWLQRSRTIEATSRVLR